MNSASRPSLRLTQIAERLNGALEGDPDLLIRGVAEPARAGPEEVVFITDKRRLGDLETSKAGAVVIGGPWPIERPSVRVRDVRLALAQMLSYFHPPEHPSPGIHEKAHVGRNVELGREVCLHPGVVLDDDVRVGDRTVLYPNVYVGRGSRIGRDAVIYANVSIYRDVEIGDRVVIHSAATLGSDGYGYAQREDGSHCKIPHVGRVVVEDDVEIGANSAVDRATLGETRIGRGTKIDNLVQVAHNVRIGEHCLLLGQAGMAGSATLGNGVILAARAGVGDHVQVGDKAILTALTVVNRDIEPGTLWAAARTPRPGVEHAKLEISLGKVPESLKTLSEHGERLAAIERFLQEESPWSP
ncbi:MAG: UDP-3-O-(3-hydroxymyristoyl)glucosamine N-acyltransferase [Nitrospinota bacterium]